MSNPPTGVEDSPRELMFADLVSNEACSLDDPIRCSGLMPFTIHALSAVPGPGWRSELASNPFQDRFFLLLDARPHDVQHGYEEWLGVSYGPSAVGVLAQGVIFAPHESGYTLPISAEVLMGLFFSSW
ncbi:hypothetical protein CSOJ01_08212 [Colletotrichum sojae]|uniref:Uncharacterized protein n=1 Tax=Colletotrichum sojae TaxID=2175907 RepID=A0A8H6MTC1_9PEZI|nr:hypothetical protein CSOJ01_08212 [Colletotrichum sojae]